MLPLYIVASKTIDFAFTSHVASMTFCHTGSAAVRTKRASLDSPRSDQSPPLKKRRCCPEDGHPSPSNQLTTSSLPTPSSTSADSSPLHQPAAVMPTPSPMRADSPTCSSPPPEFLLNSRLPNPIPRPEPSYNPDFGADVCARFKVNARAARSRKKWREDALSEREAETEVERYLVEGTSDEEDESSYGTRHREDCLTLSPMAYLPFVSSHSQGVQVTAATSCGMPLSLDCSISISLT
nr:hypothetical protein CFP56_22574 [Quercus suber]